MEETETAVLYNGACPVCSAEIGHYARYARDCGLPIRFDDLNSEARAAWGIEADAAARRLAVLHKGEVLFGVPAFLVLWAQMPRYRLLARIVSLPLIRPLAEIVYDRALAPLLYRWHKRRSAR